MKAAILKEIGKPLIVDQIEAPELDRGQVLVRIYASGICGAQINEIAGNKGPDRYLPHLMGHEGAGVVEKIGPEVAHVKPGDHVVIHWRKGKGIDSACPKYKWGGGLVGGGWNTTFQEQSIVSENRLTTIPSDVPFDVASLMGCAVTTGLGVVFNDARIGHAHTIAVIGCGGVGLNVIQGARIAKAKDILAFDCQRSKLAVAVSLGAKQALPVSRLAEARGSDVIVDTTGITELVSMAYNLIAPGGKVIMVGQPKRGEALVLPDIAGNFKGKTLMDSTGGGTDPNDDIRKYLAWYKYGILKLDELITHRFPLDQVNDALDVVRSGVAGRVILEMN